MMSIKEWLYRSLTIFILLSSILLMVEIKGLQFGKSSENVFSSVEYTSGNLHYLEYRDDNNGLIQNPVAGYAGKVQKLDQEGRVVLECYFNEKGDFIPLHNRAYWMVRREYLDIDSSNKPLCMSLFRLQQENPNVTLIRCIFLDGNGCPAENEWGQTYIEYAMIDGVIYEEYYFDKDRKPAKGNCGQNGVRWTKYDEAGRILSYVYLNEMGEPMISTHGCAEVRKVYEEESWCDYYYDTKGKPMARSEGEYGIRFVGEKNIYLKIDGSVLFIPYVFLLNHAWLVVLAGTFLIILACRFPKCLKIIFLGSYILGILYFTLFNRARADYRMAISGFESYRNLGNSLTQRIQTVCNIWLFIPLGGCCYSLFLRKDPFSERQKSNLTIIVVLLSFSVVIEIFQYFLRLGQFDVADIINNCLGSLVGYYMGFRVHKTVSMLQTQKKLESV